MDLSTYSQLAAGAVSGVVGIYYTGLKIAREIRKSKKAESEKIIKQATEHADSVKSKLEAKIAILEADLNNVKVNLAKDLDHIKEVQASEIRNLADKVDQLRQEINESTNHLITLLTTLVQRKD